MTEGFLSRSPFPRLIGAIAVATLFTTGSLAAAAPAAADRAASASRAQSTAAQARPDTGGPRWSELAPAHRKVLAPLANDWNGLDARSKERWIDVAGRFPKMPPDEQQRANQRMSEWSRMTVAQRVQARRNFQETRDVSKEEREARWKAYQALPEEEKRKLAAKRVAAAPASAASGAVATLRRRTPPALDTVQPKNNIIAAAPRAVGSAPAASQRPGVTTTLLTRRAAPPAHQHDGAPKIAAGPNSIDRNTLLPKRTTVAAASTATSAPAPRHR